jgi:AcrR family transcriptional regulator
LTVEGAATASPSRPLRRDAELNLERILVAAQDAFAEGGCDVSMEQIATRAGVGVGTLYRRFPNKEILLAAIVETAGARARQLAETVLAECAPAAGIFEFMRRCVGIPSSLRALVSLSPRLAETHLTMVALIAPPVDQLLARARAAGAIRTDVTFSDIAVILMSVRSVEDRCGEKQGERHLELLIDGLAPTTSTLPHRPLSRAVLNELLIRG